MSNQETGQEVKFQPIHFTPLKESPFDLFANRKAKIAARNIVTAAMMMGGTLFGMACEATPTPGGSNTPEPTRINTPVELTRIPTIQPTERPTFTPVPPTKTPEPTPTSIFESQLSGKEKFMVALGGGAIGGLEELTPDMIRKANEAKILELATKLNEAVVEGQLPKTTKAENIIFTFGGVKSTGGAETVGAIVVGGDQLWQADSSGVRVWVENGVSLCHNCSVMIEENKRFIVQEGKKLFRITETDATGFVNKMIEVDAGGNPIVGGKEKTSLLINALPDAQTGSNILEIPAKFLAIPEGKQLADAVSGFFNPVDGTVEFKDKNDQIIAIWDPIKGEFVKGSASEIFEKIPAPATPTPEVINTNMIGNYEIGFSQDYTANVSGVEVKLTIALSPSVINRENYPFKSFKEAIPDARNKMAEFWLKMCHLNFIKNNPDKGNIGFEDYLSLVKQGGGEITIAVADSSISSIIERNTNRKIVKLSPKNLAVVVGDNQRLPVKLAGTYGIDLQTDKGGRLILVIPGLEEEKFSPCSKFSNCGPIISNYFGRLIGADMVIIASADNGFLVKDGYSGAILYVASKEAIAIENEFDKIPALFSVN